MYSEDVRSRVSELFGSGYSTSEIAEITGVSVRNIQRWIKDIRTNKQTIEDEDDAIEETVEDTVEMDLQSYNEGGIPLVVPDMHAPFSDTKYIKWLKKQYHKYKCSFIVCLGDMIDNHTMSTHPKSAVSTGTLTEFMNAKKFFKTFLDSFPGVKVYYCLGNHDIRITKLAAGLGIPSEFLKSFRELFDLPDNVIIGSSFLINNVLYTHGTEYSGRNSITTTTNFAHKSIVLGHSHSNFGVFYTNTGYDQLFCMYCGCLIDKSAYAFQYGTNNKFKPILGCGVVYSSSEAYTIPYLEK